MMMNVIIDPTISIDLKRGNHTEILIVYSHLFPLTQSLCYYHCYIFHIDRLLFSYV